MTGVAELQPDPRLVLVTGATIPGAEQLSVLVAANAENRVLNCVNAQTTAVHCREDGFDEHRHVVIDQDHFAVPVIATTNVDDRSTVDTHLSSFEALDRHAVHKVDARHSTAVWSPDPRQRPK